MVCLPTPGVPERIIFKILLPLSHILKFSLSLIILRMNELNNVLRIFIEEIMDVIVKIVS